MKVYKAINVIIFVLLLCIATATAQEPKKIDAGGLRPDNPLYFLDVGIDRALVQLGLKNADSVAEERLQEISEARLLDDAKSAEKALDDLDRIKDQTSESMFQKIEEEEEVIEDEFMISETDALDALNAYPQLAKIIDGIPVVGIETTGLLEKKFYLYFQDGKAIRIQETDGDISMIPNIKLPYSHILKAVEDEEFRTKQLDKLLKFRQIKEDADSLIERLDNEAEAVRRGY